jgi:large exoprotein involved in heme utilization and adhesion
LLDGGGRTSGAVRILTRSDGGSGDAGSVDVRAQTVAIRNGAIVSDTLGAGKAGAVEVTATGALTITGAPGSTVGPGIFSQAGRGSTGNAGSVTVRAGSLEVTSRGQISAGTFASGDAGDVTVDVSGGPIVIDGSVATTGIFGTADRGSTGKAGRVSVRAGSLTILNGGKIESETYGPKRGGDVDVTATGPLRIVGPVGPYSQTGITAQAQSTSAGDAGSVTVRAGSLEISRGGQIGASTFASGAAGDVTADVSGGPVVIDGSGATDLGRAEYVFTGIGSQAERRSGGNAGTVTVRAGSLAIFNGGDISSATYGPGRGGDVRVTAGSDVLLTGPETRITALTIGAGEAGSIAVSAPRIRLRDGASISTQALSANGGNIAIGPGDLLHLQRGSITTSVGGGSGSGGNIAVDQRFVVLDRSVVAANAVGGNGGRVAIRAGAFVPSADSAVTATSERGVSGEIAITGVPLNLTGSLVVLASELRAAAALLREGCAARGGSPRSSLVMAGRGGQRQGMAAAEASLPALYFAHRPVRADDGGSEAWAPPARTSIRLSGRCE